MMKIGVVVKGSLLEDIKFRIGKDEREWVYLNGEEGEGVERVV
jgi:hypothetical protein